MQRKILFCDVILGILSIITFGTVLAADEMYRFMHNDHDALVVGQIMEITDNQIVVGVEKQIISAKEINIAAPRKQAPIENLVTLDKVKEYNLFEGVAEKNLKKEI
ncbi:hypothetical protein PRVXH_001580 [Proteinivorax hydrogeniformans]|uniref:hypothetical protein n=1 Tax=Proteinivorax hydrogeniformans TaxID=1826727 RepID=UPI00338F0AFA